MTRHSFHRGSLALDFVGTLGHRPSMPRERLTDRAAFAEWLRAAAQSDPAAALSDPAVAPGDPSLEPSDDDFRSALELREAIAAVLAAVADGTPLPRREIDRVNRTAARLPAPKLDPATGRRAGVPGVAAALARVAADCITLAAEGRDRLVRCELEECRALLLSPAAGERRKWCSMERCGNLAKVRAYRRRRHPLP